MKSLMLLWKVLAEELARMCHTSATLDYQTVKRRFKHEGEQFLTVSLPLYAKDLERALEYGKVTPYLFCGFHRVGELPIFMGGFVEKVFDRETGVLLEEPSVYSILAIRQLSLLFGKMQPPGTSHPGEAAAMSGFLKCEMEVKAADKNTSPEAVKAFRRMSQLLFGDVFDKLNRMIQFDEIVPKHGPGATADKLRGNRKFDQREWPDRMESVFPFGVYAIPSLKFSYLYDEVHFLDPGAERPVRVITVPKTYDKPRIIAIEPTCMQFMQQGILDVLVPELEGDSSLLSPFVGFKEQGPNRAMALRGSINQELATLDLSEASDRVSYQHVLELIGPYYPFLRDGVDACRSRKADVPGYGVIRLAKYASMGSALCFPFEEMVFLAIIFASIEAQEHRRFTRKDIKRFAGKVRVYGDDIIVPTDYVRCVIDGLESFGLKVNVNKSFWNGKFRESCGKEYYDGKDVTLVRFRKQLPTSRKSVDEVESLVSVRNQMYSKGYLDTVAALDEIIGKVLPYFPVVESTSPALGRHDVEGYTSERHDKRLHRPLVRAYVASSKPPPSQVSGEGALMKFLTKRSPLPMADVKHLQRSGRPQSSQLKLRWVTPY
uniref:RNA-directed RNA polymerase n=1 Tax=Leviviridae sp. TaxID=2027243 RepID=A0A514DDA3_9VIRU|nr:MAG: RNA-dependent RNA polymerase [Leviviridae sp.]